MESWSNFAGKINFVTQKSRKAQKVAITDGRGMGSPEGEKLQENLIQNYTKYKGSAPEGVTWMRIRQKTNC